MRFHHIPDETVRRLPFYLRGAYRLSRQGVQSISSRELAHAVGVNPWQVRKDFSYFGDFGTPGVGYKINILIKHISKILHIDKIQHAALVGVGNLGSALLDFQGFAMYGLDISAAFDSHPDKIGTMVGDVEIEPVTSLFTLKNRGISLAILAVPEGQAQEITDELVDAGVRGILNFSPCYISVPKKVKIITIDIAIDLARLPYYLPSGSAG